MVNYPRKFMGQMVHALVRNRNVRILKGAGAGLRFNAGASNPAYALGTNEAPVQSVLTEHLKPGDVFYDIGANVGFFSIIAARLVGDEGAVYAFEPLPDNVARLRENVALNAFAQIRIFDVAVSDHGGQGELLVAAFSGGSALATADAPPDQIGTLPVTIVAIDDVLTAERLCPPTLAKIDVEGAELDVLHGMRLTIERYRPLIICELDGPTLHEIDAKRYAVAAFLAALGYDLTELPTSYADGAWHVIHLLAAPQ